MFAEFSLLMQMADCFWKPTVIVINQFFPTDPTCRTPQGCITTFKPLFQRHAAQFHLNIEHKL